jgi:hypothetical protein
MAGRGPNAIDIPRPLGENEPRFHEGRRSQPTRAIWLRASEDQRDELPLAIPTPLFVRAPCLTVALASVQPVARWPNCPHAMYGIMRERDGSLPGPFDEMAHGTPTSPNHSSAIDWPLAV